MCSLTSFSRAQLGILILLGAVLFLLYGWRGNFGGTSAATPPAVAKPVFVEITGEVAHPGVYSFPAPPTLLELYRRAGGPEPSNDAEKTVASGNRVEVTPAGTYRLGHMTGDRRLTLGLALDLNTATAQDLEALPGIGPVMAQRLVQFRRTHGSFKDVEDLLAVTGIGEKKLARLKPYLAVLSPEEAGQ